MTTNQRLEEIENKLLSCKTQGELKTIKFEIQKIKLEIEIEKIRIIANQKEITKEYISKTRNTKKKQEKKSKKLEFFKGMELMRDCYIKGY